MSTIRIIAALVAIGIAVGLFPPNFLIVPMFGIIITVLTANLVAQIRAR